MFTINEMSRIIKPKLSDPINRLRSIPNLRIPFKISKISINRIEKMSKYVYILYCPDPVYVSTVFDNSDIFGIYDELIAHKVYDSIYYFLTLR